MKNQQSQLRDISKELSKLSKQVDRLAAQVEKTAKAKKIADKAAGAKKKTAKKASAAEKMTTKAVGKVSTLLDSVYDVIKRSRNGVAIATIKAKTNLDPRQLSNALYKLKKQELTQYL